MPRGWPLLPPQDTPFAAFDARLSSAEQKLSALPAPFDPGPLTNRIDALEAAPAGSASADPRIERLEAALTELLNRPQPDPQIVSGDGTDLSAALEPLRAEIEALKAERSAAAGNSAEVSALRDELAALRSAATAEREATEARAAELAREAEIRAGASRAEAAALRLATAIDAGTSLEAALQDLTATGFDLPAELKSNAAGVRTLAALQSAFPEAARAALTADARPPEGAAFGDRVTAFLFSQANVRSLHPREGQEADAVLSRMEARLKDGDLPGALREGEALPAAAAAAPAMETWLREAKARQDAATAAAALLQSAAE